MKPWGFINPFNRLVFVYKQMMGKADKLQRKMKWLYMDQTWCSHCLRAAVLNSLLYFQMNMCTVKKLQSTASQIFPCWNGVKKCTSENRQLRFHLRLATTVPFPPAHPLFSLHTVGPPLKWCIYLHKDRNMKEKQSVLYHHCFRMRNILI